jgi:hypothetical protein
MRALIDRIVIIAVEEALRHARAHYQRLGEVVIVFHPTFSLVPKERR